MPVNIPRALLVIVLLAAAGSWRLATNAQGVTEPERQLQKAILLETVDGNLQAAIDQYKKIVAQNGNNRVVAARALLRLAGCYEKLGQNEARKTYQQLINDYADQTAEVTLARQKLAALPATEAKPRFTKIRVPTGLPDNAPFALSPDGQQLAYLSESSVWLVPVHGATDPTIAGAPRQITRPNKSWTRGADAERLRRATLKFTGPSDGFGRPPYVLKRRRSGSPTQRLAGFPPPPGTLTPVSASTASSPRPEWPPTWRIPRSPPILTSSPR